MRQQQGMPGPAWDGIWSRQCPALMHPTKPGGPTSPGPGWVGEPHCASATHTAAAEARSPRSEFSRALNQSCFLNKAREELALGEIPGSQRSRSSPGEQTADKSEQTVHPQPCGADRASVSPWLPREPGTATAPPPLPGTLLPAPAPALPTLQAGDGKSPCAPCAGARSIYLMVCSK